MKRLKQGWGFTYVELIVVIVLTAIIATITTRYISATAEGFMISTRASQLTSQARLSVERMVRELREAVPYSVRVSGQCIEFLPTIALGHYLDTGATHTVDVTTVATALAFPLAPGVDPVTDTALTAQQTLTGDTTVNEFSVVSPEGPAVRRTSSVSGATAVIGTRFIVINPKDPAQLYVKNTNTGVHTFTSISDRSSLLASVGATDAVIRDVILAEDAEPHYFASHSPGKRIYYVGNPISYCVSPATEGGRMVRFTNYALSELQPVYADFLPVPTLAACATCDGIRSQVLSEAIQSAVFETFESTGWVDKQSTIGVTTSVEYSYRQFVKVQLEFDHEGHELGIDQEVPLAHSGIMNAGLAVAAAAPEPEPEPPPDTTYCTVDGSGGASGAFAGFEGDYCGCKIPPDQTTQSTLQATCEAGSGSKPAFYTATCACEIKKGK